MKIGDIIRYEKIIKNNNYKNGETIIIVSDEIIDIIESLNKKDMFLILKNDKHFLNIKNVL